MSKTNPFIETSWYDERNLTLALTRLSDLHIGNFSVNNKSHNAQMDYIKQKGAKPH